MGRKPIREQRRRQILEALYRCLLRKPYRETTMKDIGAEAGINHAMLHYYFRSKEDILLCFIENVCDRYRSLFAREVGGRPVKGASGRELLGKAFRFMNDRITTDKGLQTIFVEIWEIALYNPEVNARVKRIYTDWIRELGGIMQTAGAGPATSDRLAMSLVAFQEGIGLFSVFFDLNKGETMALMDYFQEKIVEML
ncbi:MAG TPA: TetR/AcrR family transcriptional regulator [Deltaproteobacteria bacterium]|nr:TetR/AcrR family transcriptional regulator [Deltaproteobacteria bacterium]HPA76268.1 TetR/AcrR family transcriptional regulator [Deltaproteobacteria bacterium]HPH49585.1 TetR/AcrR family transcriptional regulator [Deltaproteobacteria bacterium]HPO33250.1 TetR/AcrR family transcriptional regulator [Deltaproteobacteria bacterium]HQO61360.1 TetR/AcrR family transcriptional regulator [Deltaproteobacteria bacterium]